MQLSFTALEEATPGPRFAELFEKAWPHYCRWWSREGDEARPTFLACRRAIATHMPELVDVYDELCDLAGGGDREARFLSLYCPPPYLSACSQAVWPGPDPLLVRNYDYALHAFDALVLKTRWLGRHGVLGTSDCLIGLLDGVNDAGLAVSLTFGGRRVAGTGFGIPIVLRYVLETCDDADGASETLARIPTHMAYNVTVLDRHGAYRTVQLSPDRPAVITNAAVATNHQQAVEWHSHARATATVERERFLLQRLTLHPETADRFVAAFLRPPLYSTAFDRGFGTLYTAELWAKRGEIVLNWPDSRWSLSLNEFVPGSRVIRYSDGLPLIR